MVIYYESKGHIGKEASTAVCGAEMSKATQCFSSDMPAGATCADCDKTLWAERQPIVGDGMTNLMSGMKRLVAIGNANGVTEVAQEWQDALEAQRAELAEMAEEADYYGSMMDASCYGQ